MLKNLQRLVRKRRTAARRERAKTGIEVLKGSNLERAHAVGDAVSEGLRGILSPEEREIVTAIEKRRAELLASTEVINVIDYGAGMPEDTRTESEMAEGVRVSIPLGKVCTASKEPFWALMLFKLARKLRPQVAVELGTCVGISASYQAAAQRLNGGGRFVSLEGSPEIAKVAAETLLQLGLDQAEVVVGPFHQTFQRTMAELAPVDFLFIDGHHDRDATLAYYEEALPYLAEHAVLVFDDIAWNVGMKEAWQKITDAENLIFTLNLGQIGVVIYSKQGGSTEKFDLVL